MGYFNLPVYGEDFANAIETAKTIIAKIESNKYDEKDVKEFADNYPLGTYLVRMNGHISTVIDNCVYDSWDCRKHLLTNAWQMS